MADRTIKSSIPGHSHKWTLVTPTHGSLNVVTSESTCECGASMYEQREDPKMQLIRRRINEADGAQRFYRKAGGRTVIRCSADEFIHGIDPAGRY